jgi:SAM-dependent methyltransferase
MPEPKLVKTHYTRSGLIDAIIDGLAKIGLTPETVQADDLAPVDEFHIGGRVATAAFLDQLAPQPTDIILDVGCGLGGASRFAARHYGCHVTGIDLTSAYVETGAVLNSWVGLEDRVTLHQGDATATPYEDDTFDKAYLLHVGMNIADKTGLARELYRLIRPSGKLGVYDIMRMSPGDLTFPVPWATKAEGSAVASPDDYKAALEAAGFTLMAERSRRDFALDFFTRLQAAAAGADGPPALGLHILMGETAAVKIRNMISNITANRIAPVELIAEKPPPPE